MDVDREEVGFVMELLGCFEVGPVGVCNELESFVLDFLQLRNSGF